MDIKNIVLDIGNSSIKVGYFKGTHLLEDNFFLNGDDLCKWIRGKGPESVLISSVSRTIGADLDLRLEGTRIVYLNKDTPIPFNNLYKTPETLGPDRLAGIAGAISIFPEHNCLVIDAGTCITYDFIDKNGNYLGGGISPGLQMRLKALNHFTAKLPLVELSHEVALTGYDTKSSILSGVVHGAVAELNGIIDKYLQKYGELKVLICGGDTNFFESKLKEHIFAISNLVLIGLNRILLHNTKDFEADI